MTDVDKKIEALAAAHEEGIDTLAAAVQDLYMVIDHLTTELRAADTTLAALKYTLIRNNVIEEQVLENLCKKISSVYAQKIQNKEQQPSPEQKVAVSMQDELRLLHESAKEAAETPYDAEAFIFGG